MSLYPGATLPIPGSLGPWVPLTPRAQTMPAPATYPGVMQPAMGFPQGVAPMAPGWSMPLAAAPVLRASMTSVDGNPVSLYTLPNGHRVLLEQRPTDIISIRTYIDAGSIDENPLKPSPLYAQNTGLPSGIAHLDEHCHFLNTQRFPQKNGWPRAVEQLGATYNASTDSEYIQHELACNREQLPLVLAMHGDSVMRPFYKRQDIQQEKTNVLNEMSMRMNKPGASTFSKAMELLFDRPTFQTLGRREDVQNVTVEQLQRFHNTFYTPTNMLTVVSGRVDPNTVLPLLQREFGQTPPRISPHANPSLRVALRPGEVRHATVVDPLLSNSLVQLAFPAPAKADLKERIAMECLTMLLGDGPLSMLQTQVQDRQRLTSSINVDYTPLKSAGMYSISMETEPGMEQRALGATLHTVSQLSNWLVTPQKLYEVQQRLAHKYRRDMQDVETSTMLMGEEGIHNSLPYVFQYLPVLNSLTPQDLMTTARKYLSPLTYAVAFGVPPKQQAAEEDNSPASIPEAGGPRWV